MKTLTFLSPNQIVPDFELLIENFPPDFIKTYWILWYYYVCGNFKGKIWNKNIYDGPQYAHTLWSEENNCLGILQTSNNVEAWHN